jgi:hypothetical protein
MINPFPPNEKRIGAIKKCESENWDLIFNRDSGFNPKTPKTKKPLQ